jgi:lipopolysaccharide export system permease protein
MLLVGLAQKAREHGIGPDIVVQLVPFLIPEALMFAIPATSLFSVCVVFGRMASDNEVTALESLGLSKAMVVMPALVMAFGLSLFAVWLNDIAYAWSHWGIERVVLQSTDKIVYSVLKQEGSFKSDQFSIEVDGVTGRRLIRPTVTFSGKNNKTIHMTAASGKMAINLANQSLEFRMEQGKIASESGITFVDEESSPLEIPLGSPDKLARENASPSNLYLSQISSEISDQKIRLNELQEELALDATTQWLTGDFVGLTDTKWQTQTERLKDSKNRYNRLHVVPHRRWANGFSCLAFAIIGVPVALRLRTGNYATSFGACFVPILLLYYPLFMFGLNGAKMSTLPPYAAWMGNIACAIVGLVLLRRELTR